MRVSNARAVLASGQEYVCISCRLHNARIRTRPPRRYQHTSSTEDKKSDHKQSQASTVASGNHRDTPRKSSSTLKELIKGFIYKEPAKLEEGIKQGGVDHDALPAAPVKNVGALGDTNELPQLMQFQDSLSSSEPADDGAQATQKALQEKYAAARRKQRLQMQRDLSSKKKKNVNDLPEDAVSSSVSAAAKSPSKKALRSQKIVPINRAEQRRQAKLERRRLHEAAKIAKAAKHTKISQDEEEIIKSLASPSSQPTLESENDEKLAELGPAKAVENAPSVDQSRSESSSKDEGPLRRILRTVPDDLRKDLQPLPQSGKRPRKVVINDSEQTSKHNDSGEHRLSETERKEELAKKLGMIFRKHITDDNPKFSKIWKGREAALSSARTVARTVVERKKGATGEHRKPDAKVSDGAHFDSLKGALGRKAAKLKTMIEKADATKLEILPLEVAQPPVPSLSYGLERVLFNPGVYQLQDPRSRVFNFDPYLQKIMPVAEFDFNALKEYITSSRDESLHNIAREHGKRYMGSTSSMTGALSHFHFLLSQWRPINTSMMSKNFPTHLTSFTELQRTPQAIFLRWKDGSYAIDADKQFANANVLSMLGKSMEKLLTLSTDDYERYRKSTEAEVSDEESLAPESYHYSTMGDFLMRSQLDAHDPRLPGTGMFDLKTRAVVSIRMDVSNYEHGLGYQIRRRQGEWESYEREYYDMIRAAFLKYSMQVRMGRMDGIFVAFHNIERIFGFQYISLPEMDSTIHGQWDTSIGDQEFKLSLDLLNKILDKATKKYPETSLRIHFETREAATPFMYVFAEPVTEGQVAEIQSQNDAKIREFERNILGLKRGEESESQDDDGKWENIQASVQEEMDRDELSVDHPEHDQGHEDDEVESEQLSSSHGVLNEGPLYANTSGPMDDNDEALDEDEKEEVEDGEIEEAADDATEEQLEGGGEDEGMQEQKEVAEPIQDGALRDDREPNDIREVADEDSAVLHDPVDDSQSSIGSALDSDLTKVEQSDESQFEEQKEDEQTVKASAATKNSIKQTEKAAYSPPVMGNESAETDFPTEADNSFLDSIHEENAHLESISSGSSDILAMTLTVRNKVNDKYVFRPENLTADDVWSIEYSLIEVPDEKRARALYEACQLRRKKKLDAPMVPEDAEVINQYLMNLRRISTRGKQWRKEMDEKDRRRPVQVLGREIIPRTGGASGSGH